MCYLRTFSKPRTSLQGSDEPSSNPHRLTVFPISILEYGHESNALAGSNLSDQKPITSVRVQLKKPKSEKALRAERVREWELREGRSFEDTVAHMIAITLACFGENPKHFSREIERAQRNFEFFLNQIQMGMSDSLHEYIDREFGYSESTRKIEAEEWKESYNILMKIDKLLGRIPKKKMEILSENLENSGYANLIKIVRPSIRRSRIISLNRKGRYELRGSKRTPVSTLALALFDNLEWRLNRNLARSFAIAPSKEELKRHPERKSVRDFVGLDAKLIFRVVCTVKPNAVIDTVQSALKAMPSQKSEK